jgi:predicted nucleic acid-binding protein
MLLGIRVFLDASALVSAVWSETGGARHIMQLGEDAAVVVLVSSQVLRETDNAFRRKKPAALPLVSLLLERCYAETVPDPPSDTIEQSQRLTGYAPDAHVLAAAWTAGIEYFVTLDREHFLDNVLLRSAVPFLVGTPGDFIAWYRDRLREDA